MSLFSLSPAKQKELEERMERAGIRESDLCEQFILGSGSGGQKINKTSSTVLLTHSPSGIQVRCQKSRSQILNRFYARRMLVEKIESLLLKEKSEKEKQIEKIRRQKRKRSKRAKEKILAAKHHQGEKKRQRRARIEE